MTKGTKAVEATLDEMLRETFPASDSPQLDGLPLEGKPARQPLPRHPGEHAPPPQVLDPHESGGNAFDVPEQHYRLGDRGGVTLSTRDGEVQAAFSDSRLKLDAKALEDLIAALERHRPSLNQR